MPNADTQRQWEELAPSWIQRIQDGESNREGLLDRWMVETVGDVTGQRVVDLGCGEGRFCRMLCERGVSYVLGVDLTEGMIESARVQKRFDAEEYRVGNIETLEGVEDEAFDIAVSYVSLVDIEDFGGAVASAFRVIKPGGRFIVCNLSPMATAMNQRITDPDGTRTAFRVDHYLDEGARVCRIMGLELTNFHRTLSTHINGFVKAGFVIQGVREPFPNEEDLKRFPELTNELRAPGFVIFELQKPN